ncbi:MAG: hypothetical protein B1H11_09010 [Desulfobacteraceae bacterium 4484_190.1]|nr:MAG: hypothetical protein B1H11_09010 [Desulfobacteraceae bacterium 4484_190.1]
MGNSKPHFNVAAAIILKNDRVLITKRLKGSHLEGFWEFPGGKQEKGESLEDCLEREIDEELGLKIRANNSLLIVNHDYGFKSISLYVFGCTIIAGEPRALQCLEIRWVDPADLEKFEFPPPDLKIIELLNL